MPYFPANNPRLTELDIVQTVSKNVMGNGQSERQVGARANRQPTVCLGCSDGTSGIDNDHFCLVAQAPVIDHAKIDRAGLGHIIPQKHVEFCTTKVVAGIAVTTADLSLSQFIRNGFCRGAERTGSL